MKKTVLMVGFLWGAVAQADEIADIYKAKCKSCHGETGKADTKNGRKYKMDDLSKEKWQARHTDEEIREVIAEGDPDNEKMKPFKNKLTAAQIDGLVQYVRSFRGK